MAWAVFLLLLLNLTLKPRLTVFAASSCSFRMLPAWVLWAHSLLSYSSWQNLAMFAPIIIPLLKATKNQPSCFCYGTGCSIPVVWMGETHTLPNNFVLLSWSCCLCCYAHLWLNSVLTLDRFKDISLLPETFSLRYRESYCPSNWDGFGKSWCI